jgi:ubiquinone/menaquinone biosynthesis C-methylase UbiE
MNNQMRENLRKAYKNTVREPEEHSIQDWKLVERKTFLSLLIQEGKKSLLEIGAGTGKDSLYFRENGLEVVCIDLSPEMVKYCQQKGLSAKVTDMADLQFPDQSFDAV